METHLPEEDVTKFAGELAAMAAQQTRGDDGKFNAKDAGLHLMAAFFIFIDSLDQQPGGKTLSDMLVHTAVTTLMQKVNRRNSEELP